MGGGFIEEDDLAKKKQGERQAIETHKYYITSNKKQIRSNILSDLFFVASLSNVCPSFYKTIVYWTNGVSVKPHLFNILSFCRSFPASCCRSTYYAIDVDNEQCC